MGRIYSLFFSVFIPFLIIMGMSSCAPDDKITEEVDGRDQVELLLDDAWKEYGFREFHKAEKLFQRAALEAVAKEDIFSARTGLAFCHQFAKKLQATPSDYEYAISQYEQCLDKAGNDPKFAPFFKSMIAECNFRIYELTKTPKNLAKAEKLWDEIQKNAYSSVVAQDALLFRNVVPVEDYADEDTSKRILAVEKYLIPLLKEQQAKKKTDSGQFNEGLLLSPIMAAFLERAYFNRKDFQKSVDWSKTYCDLGPTSYSAKANAYFRTARTADTKLNDSRTARKYYSLLYRETGNDRRAYYAMERVRKLGSESISGEKKEPTTGGK